MQVCPVTRKLSYLHFACVEKKWKINKV
jgi:hypothetical protein